MPAILLLLGLLAGTIAVYRYVLKASAQDVKTILSALLIAGLAIAALFLAVTGRLPVALGFLVFFWPLGIQWKRRRQKKSNSPPSDSGPALTETEAFKILGLPDSAGADEIRAAHLRLMKKLHPDQAGSDWLAQKINAAKDLLLKTRA